MSTFSIKANTGSNTGLDNIIPLGKIYKRKMQNEIDNNKLENFESNKTSTCKTEKLAHLIYPNAESGMQKKSKLDHL